MAVMEIPKCLCSVTVEAVADDCAVVLLLINDPQERRPPMRMVLSTDEAQELQKALRSAVIGAKLAKGRTRG